MRGNCDCIFRLHYIATWAFVKKPHKHLIKPLSFWQNK